MLPSIARPGLHRRVLAVGGKARRIAAVARSASKTMDNPLYGSDVPVLTPQGQSVPIGKLVEGKFCWEQAQRLLSKQELFQASGFRLMAISVGSPESGREFCQRLPFPEELLYLDPSKAVYDQLSLYRGLGRTFFNIATPKALLRRQGEPEGFSGLVKATTNYKMIMPKRNEDAFQQGGLLVLDGPSVLFFHRDEATSDHANMDDVLAACCPAGK